MNEDKERLGKILTQNILFHSLTGETDLEFLARHYDSLDKYSKGLMSKWTDEREELEKERDTLLFRKEGDDIIYEEDKACIEYLGKVIEHMERIQEELVRRWHIEHDEVMRLQKMSEKMREHLHNVTMKSNDDE